MRIGAKEVFISLTTNMLECTPSPGRGRFLLAEGIRETDPEFEIPGRSRASNRNPALGEHGEGDGSGQAPLRAGKYRWISPDYFGGSPDRSTLACMLTID